MDKKSNYTFNEKTMEWSSKDKKEIPVWQSNTYKAAKEKAIALIEKGQFGIKESDFWILMNETKTQKMQYSGLIISHKACLKINDTLSEESRFVPSCVTCDKEGFSTLSDSKMKSLVFTYCNDKQGIYEVGEVCFNNCQNAYPYAMAFKRLFDRVVLKLSKLAFDGIYSEAEIDGSERLEEENQDTKKESTPETTTETKASSVSTAQDEAYFNAISIELEQLQEGAVKKILESRHVSNIREVPITFLNQCRDTLIKRANAAKAAKQETVA